MLTITVDPSFPQGAIEDASNLVEMLGDLFTRATDVEPSEGTLAGAGHVVRAVVTALQKASDAISAATRDANGRVQPLAPRAAVTSAKPVPEEAVALVGGMVAAARAVAAGVPTRAESIAKLAAHRGISEAKAEALIDDAMLLRTGTAGEAADRARTAKAAQSLINATKPRADRAPSLTEPRAATGKRRRAA